MEDVRQSFAKIRLGENNPNWKGFQLCSVEGCGRKKLSKGYCSAHAQRWRKHGDVQAHIPITKAHFGKDNNKWKGGQTVDGHGRILVRAKDHPFANAWGYVYRYRVVVERSLGRFLESHEIVHHKDGNTNNDDINNLEVMSQSKHMTIHFEDLQIGKKRRALGNCI